MWFLLSDESSEEDELEEGQLSDAAGKQNVKVFLNIWKISLISLFWLMAEIFHFEWFPKLYTYV
jgi:hypothetical protein